ncbi:MAG: N-6 DNA methylase [Planctomycetes bacterium]|nr:N-6 DNA methylase [Planctomycetota bacterium]
MPVFEIKHHSENDPRVTLSRETFRILASHGKEQALILFISTKTANFRLSLVTLELKLEGREITKDFSNPRRLSFFLGPETKTHTIQEYLLKPGRVKCFDDLKERFSIEIVTKEFYREYAKIFGGLEKAIASVNKLKDEELRLYTQTLMNRLMFLRFLEKKRWIQFGDSPDYLANLYAAGGLNGESFFKSRLSPLFFVALAIEGQQDFEAVGSTVFLNGGLFEEDENLDGKVDDIPDNAFSDILGPDGLFYKYNFTVEESTPLDIEVAVDPEMLGKVFEELVTGRHESGSYYTPRAVVSFMCREAIKGYLFKKTSAAREAIEKLVDEHELEDGSLTEKDADDILYYLETLKALDPACGSGAYLLGLLQELMAIRRALQNQKLRAEPNFHYELKLRAISRNLYGVDIDPFATNIAKLRLWLSLAVEADSPQPLPNLDFKIETGDAVLGPCNPLDYDSDKLLFLQQMKQRSETLVIKKDEYLTAHGDRKKQLYDEIKKEEDEIASDTSTAYGQGVIAWHVHFAEVFMSSRRQKEIQKGIDELKDYKVTTFEPGGFDIVLANPPYIRQELIKDDKLVLKDIYKDTFVGTADLYTYFYTRAVELLAPGGVLSFISPNKWFRANYGKKLRGYIAEKCNIISVTDFGELPVFETAATFPMIFVAQKTETKSETTFTQVKTLDSPYPDVKAIIRQSGSVLPSDAIEGEDWNLTDAETIKTLRKMEASGISLKEYVNGEIYRGILTGFNKAFVIDSKTREKLIEEDPASEDLIKPMAKGDDVRKWHIRDKDRWIIVTPINVEIDKYRAIFSHLKKWENELKARQDQGNHWWELRPCTYYGLYDSPKIHYPEIAKERRFAFDDSGIYPLKTVFTIPTGNMYLLGILNSSSAWEYLKRVCSVLGDEDKGGRLTLQTIFVEQLPIPKASSGEKKTIEKLVKKCLDAGGINCEKWESEIDKIVTKLYGLDD